MIARLSPNARRLVDEPNFAHLATLLSDGAPKVDPVWVLRDDTALSDLDHFAQKSIGGAK